MSVNIIQKPETNGELTFQNNDGTLRAEDIERIDVIYEGEPLWSCSGCKELKKEIIELKQENVALKEIIQQQGAIIQQQGAIIQQQGEDIVKLKETVKDLRQEREQQHKLDIICELISVLYSKMYYYAKDHLELPNTVDKSDFLRLLQKKYRPYFVKCLEHFQMDLQDFTALKEIKKNEMLRSIFPINPLLN